MSEAASTHQFAETGFTQSWQVGRVRITRIVEVEMGGGTRFILPDATPEACQNLDWMAPYFMLPDGKLIMSVHALVIEAGERCIVVDTCIGNDKPRNVPAWNQMATSFLEDLTAAGFPPETIDTVLCTHLHVDHVGWNTRLVDGVWVPTFPQARYLFAETEWRHWDANEDEAVYGPVLADSVRPVFEAGLADLVPMDFQLCPEVRLEPTPGHTPGHVSVHIESEGEEALITGDCIHHPCQFSRTDWCSSADSDPTQGQETREALLARYCDQPVLIIGTHLADATYHMLTDQDPHLALFDDTDATLQAFADPAGIARALLRWQWCLLRETGYVPTIDRDVRTGAELDTSLDVVGFSPREGGLILEPHVGEHVWNVRRETITALQDVASAESDPEASSPTRGTPDVVHRANRLLAAYCREILGRELPTVRWMFRDLPRF